MDGSSEAAGLTPGKGLVVLVCVVIGIAAYIGLGAVLGIVPLYAGFAFSLYFGGIRRSEAAEFVPALVGSLGGLLLAALLHLLPIQFGAVGLGVALVLILAAIYALLMGWATLLVNYAFMLMLTIGTIPAVQAEARFVGMACSILLAAVMMGALLLIGGLIARRSKPAEAPASHM